MKFVEYSEFAPINRENYDYYSETEPLTEENLSKAVSGYDKNGYAMVSAIDQSFSDRINYKSGNNNVLQKNKLAAKSLHTDISNSGYLHIPIYGGYKLHRQGKILIERAFIVFSCNYKYKSKVNFHKFIEDMIRLGKRYNQNFILARSPEGTSRYYGLKSEVWVDDKFVNESLNDVQRLYFAKLKRRSPKIAYFESYLNKAPQSLMSAHARASSGERFYFKPSRHS